MKCQILPRFSLPVCVFPFLQYQMKRKKNHNYPQFPGVYSCQGLDCTATNQPLSGKDGALKAAASGRTGGRRAGCNFCQGPDHPCLWMSNRNVVGVGKHPWDHSATWLIFPNCARLDKAEYDLSVFTGCQRGINITVSDKKKKEERLEYWNKLTFIKQIDDSLSLTLGKMKKLIKSEGKISWPGFSRDVSQIYS